MRTIAVMVTLETDDPLLDPDRMDVSTVAATQALRRAVVANLPNLVNVVAVLPEELAKLMMRAHELAMQEAKEAVVRPPADYQAPGRQR